MISGGKAHPQGVGAIVGYHWSRGRLTFEDGSSVERYFFGSKSGSRCNAGIDLENHCRTTDRVIDSIQNIHDTWNFLNRIRQLRRPGFEYSRVLRKQLNLDRLRGTGQIADHVLQSLYEFNVKGGFLLFNFRTNVFHDFLDTPTALLFQLYGKIAGIRLRNGSQPQLQPGSTRGALHFGGASQNLFDVTDDTICFRQ